MNVLGQHCPHCGRWATVRSSESVSPLLRVLLFQCRDVTCGHTWISHLEVVRSVSPPAIPNPAISLPLSSRAEVIRRRLEGRSNPDQGSLFNHEE